MRLFTITFLMCAAALVANQAHAHGGGLDKSGCHTNKKTGDYHCHRSRGGSSSLNSLPNSAANSSARRTRPFANCSEARAAGAAPVYRGDPGYGPHLDRDNDGVGCEPYRGRR